VGVSGIFRSSPNKNDDDDDDDDEDDDDEISYNRSHERGGD